MAVTPTEYVKLLNEALQADPNYQPGMRFSLYPDGSGDDSCRGIAWEAPSEAWGLGAAIQSRVARETGAELE